ncbi:hypothetical protein CMV_015068 [Castanea mollissima]|uniref:Uncharacterized protein n=1 Tax=Castanea mollissima TaxID=60419 RepID=A0A8J4RAQ4_9ROSI|nr:hypothetical protein CMV_015068 [Castanea mollissima]
MMGLSQSNRSGSDANESSLVEINGTFINTQISVISINSCEDSSFCQQSIMREIAQGESNRTDGGVVFQAANCGRALVDTSPELRQQAGVSPHMKLLNWNTPIRLVKVTPLLTSLRHATLLNWKSLILDRASKNCTTFMASLQAT